jgi:hypothetical protein
MKFFSLALGFILLFSAEGGALDLWQYPECAEPFSLFLDIKAAGLSFDGGFHTFYPEFSADFLVPFIFPLSIGFFVKTPEPNLKSFGPRAAYHINLGDDKTDLYVLYVFDLGFIRNDLLEKYNDERQSIHYFDFRPGVRRLIGKYTVLVIESAFKFQGLTIGLSLKLL